ncbi:MAG: hypothetical protein ABI035_04355 [Gemmatimonadaceae bacterium]
MAVTLVQIDEPQVSADGRLFTAQVRAQQLQGGLWEAWLEFQPSAGGDSVSTAPETQQLSRSDLRYWAAGITRQHLATALERALQSHAKQLAQTVYGRWSNRGEFANEARPARYDDAVLDPIALYERTGEYALRQVLRELDAPELADIIESMGLDAADMEDLAPTFEDALAERIVVGVQQCVESNRTFSRKTDVGLTD